jgi:enoyl-CoA hydratase
MSDEVHVEVTTPLATVHLERPDALTDSGWRALAEAIDGLSARDDVACIVVTGAGGRSGVLGRAADRPVDTDGPEDAPAGGDAIAAALRSLRCSTHPTVAVIEGLCVGLGLEVAACCDLRVCGESTLLGKPARQPGRTMASSELEPLVQLLGASPVLEVLLGGELIGAERALAYGLVNRVHADATLVEQGYGLAARIAAGAPLVNRWHKTLVRRLHERRGA